MEFKRSWAGTRLKGKLAQHTYLQLQGPIISYSLGAPERVNGWESDTGSDLCQGDLDKSEADGYFHTAIQIVWGS
jgi:hypothetical protein